MTSTSDYAQLVDRWRRLAVDATDSSAKVAVVSRGDGALLAVSDRQIRHFPADGVGQWVGYHPANGKAALEELRRAHANGITHLAIPATSGWWLDHYPELADALLHGARVVGQDPDTATIYELSSVDRDRHDASPSTAPSTTTVVDVRAPHHATTSYRQQHHLIQMITHAPRHAVGAQIAVGCPPDLLHHSWNALHIGVASTNLTNVGTLVIPDAHRNAWDPRVAARSPTRTLFERPGIGRVVRFAGDERTASATPRSPSELDTS